MMADAMRTHYKRDKKDDDDEVMDLSDPKMVEKLRRMANASYGQD